MGEAATKQDIQELKKEMKESFDEFASLVNAGFTNVQQQLNQVDTRFDQVDTRLDQVDTRLDQVDTRLKNVDTRLDQVDTRLKNLETSSEKLDRRITGREDFHIEEVSALKKRVNFVEEKLNIPHPQKA